MVKWRKLQQKILLLDFETLQKKQNFCPLGKWTVTTRNDVNAKIIASRHPEDCTFSSLCHL